MSNQKLCQRCGSTVHDLNGHRVFYDDSREERLAWLEGWQSARCGSEFPSHDTKNLRDAFSNGMRDANQP